MNVCLVNLNPPLIATLKRCPITLVQTKLFSFYSDAIAAILVIQVAFAALNVQMVNNRLVVVLMANAARDFLAVKEM